MSNSPPVPALPALSDSHWDFSLKYWIANFSSVLFCLNLRMLRLSDCISGSIVRSPGGVGGSEESGVNVESLFLWMSRWDSKAGQAHAP